MRPWHAAGSLLSAGYFAGEALSQVLDDADVYGVPELFVALRVGLVPELDLVHPLELSRLFGRYVPEGTLVPGLPYFGADDGGLGYGYQGGIVRRRLHSYSARSQLNQELFKRTLGRLIECGISLPLEFPTRSRESSDEFKPLVDLLLLGFSLG